MVVHVIAEDRQELGTIDISVEEFNHFSNSGFFQADLLLQPNEIERMSIDGTDYISVYAN